MSDGESGTWDFRVRVTHVDREAAERMIEGNTHEDPFGLLTIEDCLGPVDPNEADDE